MQKGINKTEKGTQVDKVEFRCSQRIGNKITAHERGIFMFTFIDNESKIPYSFWNAND